MPNYMRSDRDYILSIDEVKAMLRTAPNLQARAWISVLWLTGARPAEVLLLKKIDILIESNKTSIKLKTLKHKDTHRFTPHHRNLCLSIEQTNVFVSAIDSLLKRRKEPDSKVFNISIRTGYNIINNAALDALGFSLCPYNFRHSRLTLLAESGASEELLKRFKGAFTAASVRPYLHVRKVDYEVEV